MRAPKRDTPDPNPNPDPSPNPNPNPSPNPNLLGRGVDAGDHAIVILGAVLAAPPLAWLGGRVRVRVRVRVTVRVRVRR